MRIIKKEQSEHNVEKHELEDSLATFPKNESQSIQNDSDEYEYVEIRELSTPFFSRLKNIFIEHKIVFICLIFLLVSGILIAIGTSSSIILIIIAFVFLASTGIFTLYSSWKSMKDAKKKAAKAEKLLEEVKKHQQDELNDE